MNTLPSTFTWSVMVCGPITGGVLQRNLVKVASIIKSRWTEGEGIRQEESSRGISYMNCRGNISLHKDSGQLAFELPDFSKHPYWEVSIDEMGALIATDREAAFVRVAADLKADGDSDPLDRNHDSIISFCDISAGTPTSCNCTINRDWMSWEPQFHPIVELVFTDCYTGKKLDLEHVAVILRIRQSSG
jgi:hypothetical protein